jgi:dTDP-4-amino-4,6-dideoxygalactose transaminase
MAAEQAGLPQIPLTDLRLEPEDIDAVAETLRSGTLATGPRTEAFERAFAEQLGCSHALAVSNCTAALHLAYLAAGVGPGDEVIVPSMTFVATAAAVIYAGGTPVFADVRGTDDLGLDPADVEARITPRTKAVTSVHFAGYPAAPADLSRLCAERGIAFVEDAAHAPSATLDGRKLGTFGLAGCFSLFSNKILSVGEGGLVATDDDDVAELVRRLRSQGATPSGDVRGLGFNYRLDEPRSALALSRLARLEADIERRRELVLAYRRRLAGLDGVIVPYRDEDVATSSCYVMPILVADPERREEVRRVLREDHGVQTSVLYPAIHEFTAYRERVNGLRLHRTELVARSEITLPLYPHMTAEEQERVLVGVEAAVAG